MRNIGAGHLAENVLHFARLLRAAGVPVGPDKVMQAVRALPRAGFDRRADWHAVLATLFLTRHEQQAVFDEAFAIFWRDPALEERMRALLLPRVQGIVPPSPGPRARVAEAFLPTPARAPARESDSNEVELDATLTFSAAEQLRSLDFEQMGAREWAETRLLVARLRLPVPEVPTRRYRPASGGAAIDLAATLRAMARRGGTFSTFARRERRFRPPPMVVLCDISGSMHRYTRMFLHFLHALTRDRERVSTFLFGTRLTNVTRPLRDRDVDDAVKKVSDAVPDWAGGTRIASCLREFNFRWARRLLAQNATVMIVTDGLDRDEAEGLELEMARLHRSCRRLLWLNPLLRYEGFEPRAAGIRSMLPHVDCFLPMHNVESLTQVAQALARAARGERLAA